MKDLSKPAKHVLILLAATAFAARDKICHPGQSGLFLRFFGLPQALRQLISPNSLPEQVAGTLQQASIFFTGADRMRRSLEQDTAPRIQKPC